MIRNLLALTGLLAVALLSAVTLQAHGYFDDYRDDAGTPVREAVNIAGLDLTSPAGIARLEARINAAIGRVCADHGASLSGRASLSQCRENAVAGVGPQVERAVAAAEERERHAYRGPPPERYASLEPLRPRLAPPAPPPPAPPPPNRTAAPPPPPVAATPPPPPSGGRLVRRTVTTTTVTTTTGPGAAVPPVTKVVKKVVVATPARAGTGKSVRTPKAARHARSPAFARRAAVANSWLPPVAWAASDRATLRAFHTGKLVRWGLTDRDGIRRSGYVTVGTPRWRGGCACRDVHVVKYNGRKQIVVAAGMRCRSGPRLVDRAV